MIDRGGGTLGTGSSRWLLLLVALLAVAVDLNSLPGTFLGDDYTIVVNNPLVASPDVRAVFASDYWGKGFDRLYRPLTILSFALNRLAFGPDPFSFHLVNVLLHAGVALLFGSTLLALGFASPLAVAAASLFAVHPIHADVVNIVVGRAELLVALFVFAGLRLALRRGHGAWPLVLGCYIAALLSKEHAIVFVPLLATADAFAAAAPVAAWRRRRLLYALLLTVTAGWLLLRMWVFRGAVASPPFSYVADNPLVGVELPVRLLTAAKVNLLNLGNLVLPLQLQSVYSGPGLKVVGSAFSGWGLAALAYIALGVAVAVHGWRKRQSHGFGIPAFFIAFAVTANCFFVTTVLMADRFAYLPAAGFCLVAAGLLLAPARHASRPALARLLLLLPVGYGLLLGSITLSRNALFKKPTALWKSSIAADPGNVRAWYWLAQAAGEEGRNEEMEAALRGAIQADPSFPDAYITYSLVLLEQGKPEAAAEAARQAIERTPQGVGLAQFALARSYLQLGRHSEALALLDEVAPIFSDAGPYWLSRGTALEGLERLAEAVEAYRRALVTRDEASRRALFDQDDRETRWRLAKLLLRLGRCIESEETLGVLLTRNPTASGYNLLGVAQAQQGKREQARRSFMKAIELDPSSTSYRQNLELATGRHEPLPP